MAKGQLLTIFENKQTKKKKREKRTEYKWSPSIYCFINMYNILNEYFKTDIQNISVMSL